jgi:hypothetical protein
LDASITPGRILFGHAYEQLLDFLCDCDTGSAKLSVMRAPVKLLRDQSLVPPQEGLRGHKHRNLFQTVATERVSQRGEAAAFGIGQAQPAPAELGFQDAIFLKQIRNHLLLMPLEPAGNHGDEHVEDHRVPRIESRAVSVHSSILIT